VEARYAAFQGARAAATLYVCCPAGHGMFAAEEVHNVMFMCAAAFIFLPGAGRIVVRKRCQPIATPCRACRCLRLRHFRAYALPMFSAHTLCNAIFHVIVRHINVCRSKRSRRAMRYSYRHRDVAERKPAGEAMNIAATC